MEGFQVCFDEDIDIFLSSSRDWLRSIVAIELFAEGNDGWTSVVTVEKRMVFIKLHLRNCIESNNQ